jgi:hypothetical protein
VIETLDIVALDSNINRDEASLVMIPIIEEPKVKT